MVFPLNEYCCKWLLGKDYCNKNIQNKKLQRQQLAPTAQLSMLYLIDIQDERLCFALTIRPHYIWHFWDSLFLFFFLFTKLSSEKKVLTSRQRHEIERTYAKQSYSNLHPEDSVSFPRAISETPSYLCQCPLAQWPRCQKRTERIARISWALSFSSQPSSYWELDCKLPWMSEYNQIWNNRRGYVQGHK